MLKDDADMVDRVKFLQEAAIMAQFRHPNVVTLHGVAKKEGKVMMRIQLLQCSVALSSDSNSYSYMLLPLGIESAAL